MGEIQTSLLFFIELFLAFGNYLAAAPFICFPYQQVGSEASLGLQLFMIVLLLLATRTCSRWRIFKLRGCTVVQDYRN